MTKVQIETTQNVLLDFQLGDVGERIMAAVLDVVVQILYWILILLFFRYVVDYDLFDGNGFYLLFIFFYVPVFFYQLAFEYFWKGQTPGKKILKLKVIRLDGAKPSLGDFGLRFVLRNIDIYGGFFLLIFISSSMSSSDLGNAIAIFSILPIPVVGFVVMAMNKQNQRIGDLAAGTIVVKMKQRVSLADTLLQVVEDKYQSRYKNVLRLSDRDIRIIKEALTLYEKNKDPKHIRVLAKKTKEILGITQKVRAAALLRTVLKDYNKLALEKDGGVA